MVLRGDEEVEESGDEGVEEARVSAVDVELDVQNDKGLDDDGELSEEEVEDLCLVVGRGVVGLGGRRGGGGKRGGLVEQRVEGGAHLLDGGGVVDEGEDLLLQEQQEVDLERGGVDVGGYIVDLGVLRRAAGEHER